MGLHVHFLLQLAIPEDFYQIPIFSQPSFD